MVSHTCVAVTTAAAPAGAVNDRLAWVMPLTCCAIEMLVGVDPAAVIRGSTSTAVIFCGVP